MKKRWNKFGSNVAGIIKNEVVLQEQTNVGKKGLSKADLLELAQHAFRRK